MSRFVRPMSDYGVSTLFRGDEGFRRSIRLTVLRCAPRVGVSGGAATVGRAATDGGGVGAIYRSDTGSCETALVVLGGSCSVRSDRGSWEALGSRANVFSGRATALYLPPGTRYEVTPSGPHECEVAVCSVPVEGSGGAPVLVRPDDVAVSVRGRGPFEREVHDIIDLRVPARTLLVGETFNRPGAWSSYPPHRHEFDLPPHEAQMDEVYYFRLDRPSGFGVQVVYAEEGGVDDAYVIRDRSAIYVSEGYHPVVAAPGYGLYYLWILAGDSRKPCMREDPAHAWVKEA